MAQLVIIGGGNMGEALLSGLSRQDHADIAVVERSDDRRAQLTATYPNIEVADAVPNAVDAIVAVKPNDVQGAATELRAAGVKRVLSIAAGIRLAQLRDWLGPDVQIVRAMPNTPALVRRGASAIASDDGNEVLTWAEGVLSTVGLVVRVPESSMDTVTAVSGSGPAYVFALAEAMINAAIAEGLTPEQADQLVRQTIVGAGELLAQSSESAAELRRRVTSPGGTTAAALSVFDAQGWSTVVAAAISAARQRGEELGAE